MTLLRTLLAFVLLHLQPIAWSGEADGPVERYFSGLETLEADFVQQVRNPDQGMMEESGGHVWIHRPGRFRWDYRTPYEQELVADGTNLWTYDRDLEQVTVKPSGEVLTDTPAMLLSGGREVSAVFEITPITGTGKLNWFRLVPRTDDSSVEEIHLGFAGEELQAMQIRDSFGNTTLLQFSDVHRNQPVDEALFRFSPPPGTDVIGTPR